jgi:hypothetical protein
MPRLYSDADNPLSRMSYRRGYAGGGSRGFNRGFPKPVEVGKEYDVEVQKLVDKEKGLLGCKVLLYLCKTARLARKLRSKSSK